MSVDNQKVLKNTNVKVKKIKGFVLIFLICCDIYFIYSSCVFQSFIHNRKCDVNPVASGGCGTTASSSLVDFGHLALKMSNTAKHYCISDYLMKYKYKTTTLEMSFLSFFSSMFAENRVRLKQRRSPFNTEAESV